MYKITGRRAPVFGKGAFICDFFCDSASDISTLPNSKVLGTGGSIPEENEVCAAGSSAYAASDGTCYVLDNNDNWTEHIERSGGSGGVSQTYVDARDSTVLKAAKEYADNKLFFSTFREFPNIGEADKLYIDKGAKELYIWDSESLIYVNIGGFPDDITIEVTI